MKKAIVALLTTILATFGYAVVDKTMDARLSDLEYQVSSQGGVISYQQDEIESLHGIGKYSVTHESTSDKISSTINPYYSRTFAVPTNYIDSNVEPYTVYPGQQEYKKVMMRASYNPDTDSLSAYPVEENGTVSENDYPLFYSYDDPICIARDDVTKTYYDDNYSVTSGYDYSYEVITYHVKGYTDRAFAGCTLYFDGYILCGGGVINEDGSFEFDYRKAVFYNKDPWFVYGGNERSFELASPRIS